MATFIKKTCACCPPTVCEGCSTCNLFPSTSYQSYLDSAGNLPDEIYFGGTRQFETHQLISVYQGAPSILGTFWGEVSGGTLLSKSGIGYGTTTNGVILEPIDPDDLSAGYTWAVYKSSARSTATYLIDGIKRHDAFEKTYQADITPYYWSGINGPTTQTLYRVSCDYWVSLYYVPDLDPDGGTYTLLSDLPSWFQRPSSGYQIGPIVGVGAGLSRNGSDGCMPNYSEVYDSDKGECDNPTYSQWGDVTCDVNVAIHGCYAGYGVVKFPYSSETDGAGIVGDWGPAWDDTTIFMTIS